MNQKHYIIIVALLIIVGGGAFYGGMKYGQSLTPARGQFGGRGGAGGNFPGRNFGAGMSAVTGQVVSKDDKSITVQGRDGSDKIVLYTATTTVGKTVSGSSSDLDQGQQVTAVGTTNSDGSVTAQSIQIRPAMMFPGQPGSGTNTPTNTPANPPTNAPSTSTQ